MTRHNPIIDFGGAPQPSYYDILGIGKSANAEEIKRAYYGAVKRVSPEHNPQEFEQIKVAYEALRNAQQRLYYDSNLELSPAEIMQLEDAQAYLAMEKTGKAVKAYEDLLESRPGNLLLMKNLAIAYEERGFFKKALVQYENVLKKTEQDMETWLKYAGCLLEHDLLNKAGPALKKAVELNEQHKLKNADILILAIIHFIDLDEAFTRLCFDYLHKIGLAETAVFNNPAILLVNLVLNTKAAGFVEDALLLGENIKPQDYGYEKIEELLLVREMVALDTSGEFDDVFIALFEHLSDNEGTPQERLEQLCMEGYILGNNPQQMRKQIRKIAVAYPRLFALHNNFFQNFLHDKNEQRMHEANYAEGKALLKKHPELVNFNSRPLFLPQFLRVC
jgi:tetratricopeptide (TPR) repeat protein